MTSENRSENRKTVLMVFAVCLLAVSTSAAFMAFDHRDDTIFTLTQTGNGTYYCLTVDGDDHFDDYLTTGSEDLSELMQYLEDNVTCGRCLSKFEDSSVQCSAFTVRDSDGSGYLVGRNYDYYYSMPCAVYCKGDGINTYSSVSTVDLSMFCDTDEAYSVMVNDTRLNAVSYIPLDGINEKGVFICINAVNNTGAMDQYREGKVDIFTTSCLRLVLNYADSAYKAAELIDQYNLHCTGTLHMFVSDNTGASYAVEVVDGETYITETELMTNHYITTEAGKDIAVSESSQTRFNTIKDALENANYSMDKEQVRDVLISVKQDNEDLIHYTRWSVIYDLETKDVVIYLRIGTEIDYSNGITYSLNGF